MSHHVDWRERWKAKLLKDDRYDVRFVCGRIEWREVVDEGLLLCTAAGVVLIRRGVDEVLGSEGDGTLAICRERVR